MNTMKSKLILCFLLICLLVSSLGIASAFRLEHEYMENGTATGGLYLMKWDNRTFDDPIRVDVTYYQSTPELNAVGVNSSWQRVVNDVIEDINEDKRGGNNSLANFGFVHDYRNPEVIMTARAWEKTVDPDGNIDNGPLAVTSYPDYDQITDPSSGLDLYLMKRTQIAVNTNYYWGIPGISKVTYDLESAIAHELGHAAGLGHMSPEFDNGEETTMRPEIAKGAHRRWGTDDTDGLIAIYGERNVMPETPQNISERVTNIKEGIKIVDSVAVKENVNGKETITIKEETRIKIVSVTMESIGGAVDGFERWVSSWKIFSNNLSSTDSADPYELQIHALYPYYTYDELQDGTNLMVSGQIISISESNWSTPDGKQPEDIVITEKMNDRGESYVNIKMNPDIRDYIYTDAVLKVDTVYSGDLKEEEIVVRFLTGTVDKLRRSDEPGLDIRNYEEGKTYLFFLGQHITLDGEDVPNHYCIITPRGALMEQQSPSPGSFMNTKQDFLNTKQSTFENFDGEQLNPETFLLEPVAPIEYTELNNPRYNIAESEEGKVPDELSKTKDYPLYTQKELRKNSDLVISGKVLSISESKWSASDGQQPKDEDIYTDVDVQIDAIYKGKLNSEKIIVRLPSGTVEELTMANQGGLDVRNYNEGDEVFLFLNYVDGNETDGLYYLSTPQCALMKQ